MADRDQPQQATHKAYSVIKREGQDDYWLNIGAAFSHADGNGLNVLLQALPINGKLVLRPPKDNDEKQPEKTLEKHSNKHRER